MGPDFSSVARVRPVKAMTLPASLEMGNMTRLRNLEYMEASFRLSASGRGNNRSLTVVDRSLARVPPSLGMSAEEGLLSSCFPGEEAGFSEDFFGEFGFQAVAEEETGIGGEADAEASNHFFV